MPGRKARAKLSNRMNEAAMANQIRLGDADKARVEDQGDGTGTITADIAYVEKFRPIRGWETSMRAQLRRKIAA